MHEISPCWSNVGGVNNSSLIKYDQTPLHYQEPSTVRQHSAELSMVSPISAFLCQHRGYLRSTDHQGFAVGPASINSPSYETMAGPALIRTCVRTSRRSPPKVT
mmetsp:Transcript_21486/g.32644  ORF Transcript_21486/g.32644 Transcript_21486/m.32644 type:complete len:104 (+) Transcript_21486:112-423(+)